MTAALLILAAVLVLLAVAVPISRDLAWQHEGATENWSPLAEVGPAVSTIDFAVGTGWPA